MFLERYGFLLACGVTLGILFFLVLNADLLLKEPKPSAPTASEGAEEVASFLAAQSAGRPVRLTLGTEPAGAVVFVDGDSVGLSPLQDVPLESGPHQFSVRKARFSTLDTLLVLREETAAFRFVLREETMADEPEEPEDPASDLAALEQALLAGADADAPSTDTDEPSEQPAEQDTPPAPREEEDRAEEVPPAPAQRAEDEAAAPDEAVEEEPLAEAPAEAAMGTVQILSQPSGASVWLDGQRVGRTPLLLGDVAVGSQQITLRLDGYEDYEGSVVVASGETSQLTAQLDPVERLGTLKILAKPWGTIYIDGTLHKSETNVWYTTRLAVGNHRVRVVHPALGKWESVVNVTAEEAKEVVVDFNGQGDS